MNRFEPVLTGYLGSGPVIWGLAIIGNRLRLRSVKIWPKNRTGPDFQTLQKWALRFHPYSHTSGSPSMTPDTLLQPTTHLQLKKGFKVEWRSGIRETPHCDNRWRREEMWRMKKKSQGSQLCMESDQTKVSPLVSNCHTPSLGSLEDRRGYCYDSLHSLFCYSTWLYGHLFLSHLPLLFTHTCLLWYLLLHSSHSHAQFAQPCTVRAASHSSCTVHTQPYTVPAQSTCSHAQFMSLSI